MQVNRTFVFGQSCPALTDSPFVMRHRDWLLSSDALNYNAPNHPITQCTQLERQSYTDQHWNVHLSVDSYGE